MKAVSKRNNADIRVEDVLQYLTDHLEGTQKLIASLTGVNESTLSANLEKPLRELATKKTGKRLRALYFVVHSFVKRGISAQAIKESLNELVYPDIDENYDSVISALHSDKYPVDALVQIAELGYQAYQKKLAARDTLYHVLKPFVTGE